MSSSLYVGNLPWSTESAELQALFATVGAVLKCEVAVGRNGRSRGYAVVEYASPADAQAAIARLSGAPSAARAARGRRRRARAPRRCAARGCGLCLLAFSRRLRLSARRLTRPAQDTPWAIASSPCARTACR